MQQAPLSVQNKIQENTSISQESPNLIKEIGLEK